MTGIETLAMMTLVIALAGSIGAAVDNKIHTEFCLLCMKTEHIMEGEAEAEVDALVDVITDAAADGAEVTIVDQDGNPVQEKIQ